MEGGVGEDHHLPGVTLRDRTILMSGEYDICASVSYLVPLFCLCRVTSYLKSIVGGRSSLYSKA